MEQIKEKGGEGGGGAGWVKDSNTAAENPGNSKCIRWNTIMGRSSTNKRIL